jgi:hypothetical protein
VRIQAGKSKAREHIPPVERRVPAARSTATDAVVLALWIGVRSPRLPNGTRTDDRGAAPSSEEGLRGAGTAAIQVSRSGLKMERVVMDGFETGLLLDDVRFRGKDLRFANNQTAVSATRSEVEIDGLVVE